MADRGEYANFVQCIASVHFVEAHVLHLLQRVLLGVEGSLHPIYLAEGALSQLLYHYEVLAGHLLVF
jgi:hypothetical protein